MGLLTDKDNGLLNADSIAEARKGKIVYLGLDEIKQYEGNIWEPNDKEIEQRKENILEVGLLQPLLVMKTDDGIILNSGHKRYLAIRQITEEGRSYRYLGKELTGVVPCQYLNDYADDETFDLVSICSNAHHPDSKEEKREKVWRLHKHYQKLVSEGNKPSGREREWITAMTGISDGTVKTLLAGFNTQESILTEDAKFAPEEEKKTDVNKEVTKKLNNINKYLEKVELEPLSDSERLQLNELLRNVQETIEALIYVNPSM